ncbi:multicopper oxidase family protein [Streptomyces sp. NBC_01537]|uniref:multicopper oxidase family protein n=1 Tax=Streptomyces sp. NBC_01537 TaxID=2903896 RepID=UPI00386C7A42
MGGGTALAGVTSALSLISLSGGDPAAAATATTALTIPELLSPTTTDGVDVYTLDMQTGTHEVISGVTSSSAGFNGSYLGPTIRVSNGDSVRMDVTNNLGADTTVHWHGAHVPAKVDGGPQVAFANGETWSPAFTINQEAATLWYHPHALGTTAKQVSQGLAGMLIVDDDSDASAALPSEYGVDDIPVILQCLASSAAGDVKYDVAGYRTSGLVFPVLVNGVNADNTTFTFAATKRRIRLRFLNASLSDIITIQRSDGATLTQVATEQGYLTSATEVSTIRLVAGSRAEVVIDAADAPTIQAVITTGWIAGGSGTYPILSITDSSSDTPADLPDTLNTITRYDTSSFTARTITLGQSGATMLINGVAGTTEAAMEANMIMTTLGAKEIWTIKNSTQLEHSFHLHDVPFQVISINGTAASGVDLGWKDTVEVIGTGTVVIAMEFTDYTDDTYMYMLHCHLAQHEDEGMMAGLMVTAS